MALIQGLTRRRYLCDRRFGAALVTGEIVKGLLGHVLNVEPSSFLLLVSLSYIGLSSTICEYRRLGLGSDIGMGAYTGQVQIGRSPGTGSEMRRIGKAPMLRIATLLIEKRTDYN